MYIEFGTCKDCGPKSAFWTSYISWDLLEMQIFSPYPRDIQLDESGAQESAL